MYFEDLTKYSYRPRRPVEQVSNIGWLEGDHSFATGNVNPLVCHLLKQHYDALTANQTRGHHECPFCSADESAPFIQVEAQSFQLGAAELWVPDGDASAFAAPDLIIHYICKHSYLPPDAFIAAVMRLPTTVVGWDGASIADTLCVTATT